jgi:hypothetical protein
MKHEIKEALQFIFDVVLISAIGYSLLAGVSYFVG